MKSVIVNDLPCGLCFSLFFLTLKELEFIGKVIDIYIYREREIYLDETYAKAAYFHN